MFGLSYCYRDVDLKRLLSMLGEKKINKAARYYELISPTFYFYFFVDVFFLQNRDKNTYLIPEGLRFRLHIPAVTTVGG